MDDSAGTSDTAPRDSLDLERIMATLNSFGATMDTHARILADQGQRVQQHDQALQDILTEVRRIGNLPSPAPAPNPTPAPSPAPPSHEPRLPAPQRYNGNPGGCRGLFDTM